MPSGRYWKRKSGDKTFRKFSARALHFWDYELLLCSKPLKTDYLKKFLLIAFVLIVSTASAQVQQSRVAATAGVQTNIVRFYPNPATTVINFDFQRGHEQGYSIQIFNAILGRKMYEQGNMPERTTINLSDFPRGMYIYQLRDKSGRMIESGKFQVAK